MQAENTPLILAGVEFLLPIYQEASSYNNLLETGVTGNPENVAPEELHRQAWAVIEPYFAAVRVDDIGKFRQLSETSPQEASDRLEQIVAAAAVGQLDTLFVVEDAQYWGEFDPQSNRVATHPEQKENSIDLIDFAASKTYLQGGRVYLLKPEEMPDNTPMAATFRYRVHATANKV